MDDDLLLASSSWNVLTPSLERKALDRIIFDALNLTQDERDAVYGGVINLVKSRLDKAKSLAEKNRERVEIVRNLTGVWMAIPDVEEEEKVLGEVDA